MITTNSSMKQHGRAHNRSLGDRASERKRNRGKVSQRVIDFFPEQRHLNVIDVEILQNVW